MQYAKVINLKPAKKLSPPSPIHLPPARGWGIWRAGRVMLSLPPLGGLVHGAAWRNCLIPGFGRAVIPRSVRRSYPSGSHTKGQGPNGGCDRKNGGIECPCLLFVWTWEWYWKLLAQASEVTVTLPWSDRSTGVPTWKEPFCVPGKKHKAAADTITQLQRANQSPVHKRSEPGASPEIYLRFVACYGVSSLATPVLQAPWEGRPGIFQKWLENRIMFMSPTQLLSTLFMFSYYLYNSFILSLL